MKCMFCPQELYSPAIGDQFDHYGCDSCHLQFCYYKIFGQIGDYQISYKNYEVNASLIDNSYVIIEIDKSSGKRSIILSQIEAISNITPQNIAQKLPQLLSLKAFI